MHAEMELEWLISYVACVVRLWVTAGGRFEAPLCFLHFTSAANGAELYIFQSVGVGDQGVNDFTLLYHGWQYFLLQRRK